MSTFIRATEIWTPSRDGQHLDLTSGLYGELEYFELISRGMRFDYDEGLPGKAWAEGKPIVLKNLTNSYFRRGDAAMTEGLTCAVALPIYGSAEGKELSAVIVFFCGDDKFHVGALELWGIPEGEIDMSLEDGYFGTAERFEFTSRHTTFPRKMGLPGKVWDEGMPVIMEDLGRAGQFVRRDAAEKVGISRGIGIPAWGGDGREFVLTFLSARNSPIAKRFETWVPTDHGFAFDSGYCESGCDLAALHADTVPAADTGIFAKARESGAPMIGKDLITMDFPPSKAAAQIGLENMVALPIFVSGQFKAILAWYL